MDTAATRLRGVSGCEIMSARDDRERGEPVVGDTLPGPAAQPLDEDAEVAPGVVLDPETRQPMEVEAGAAPPPTAPPDMLGLPDDNAPQIEHPDDLQGPPS
jgi:hypothetical protein